MGKTELAKALAELLFDSEKMMIRVDMGAPQVLIVKSCSSISPSEVLLAGPPKRPLTELLF